MTRNGRSVSTSYAEQFKPAQILGAQTLNEFANNSYLQERKEGYDAAGMPILYSSNSPTEPDLNSLYRLDTLQVNVQPVIRPVEVSGKTDFQSFLIELQDNCTGLTLVMLQESDGAVFCNVRLLPFSTLEQLLNPTASKSGLLKIKLPVHNIIKLNVTLKASNVGEVLYQTHKTDITLDDLSDDDRLKLKARLELNAAKSIAHYVSQMLTPTPPPQTVSDLSAKSRQTQTAQTPLAQRLQVTSFSCVITSCIKTVVLGATLVATTAGAVLSGIGIATTSPMFSLSGTVLSALGGIGRNLVGLSTVQPSIQPILDGAEIRLTNAHDSNLLGDYIITLN